MAGSENRRLLRFELEIPVLVDSSDHLKQQKNTYLLSRDLSGTGVFVFTRDPLPVNALVRLGMILDIKSMDEPAHKHYSLIEVAGTVHRAESSGMAILFESEFKISPIDGMSS